MTKPKRHALKNLRVNKIALVDAGAGGDENHRVSIALWKRRIGKAGEAMSLEELLKAIEALSPEDKAKLKTALAPAPALKEGDPIPEEEKKRLSPEVRAMLQKRDEEFVAMVKRDAETRAEVAKIRDSAEQTEYVAKAREKHTLLPASHESIAKLRRKADKGIAFESADATELDRIFTACEEQLKQADILRKSIGGGGRGLPANPDSPAQKIESIAKKLQENDPKLTKGQATNLAWKQNPDLFRAYNAEKRS